MFLQITYYAHDDDLSDDNAENCEQFRKWAANEISKKFPNTAVVVKNEPSDKKVAISHVSMEDVEEFCSDLWNRWVKM